MKVAYYSPLPPSRSGIADYSALLLPALAARMDVAVARPGRLRRIPRADLALYHVGNDAPAHGWIVEALRRRPGVVVLHDFVLHHLVVELTFGRGGHAGYLEAMEREAGVAGRLLAHAVLDNRIRPLWETHPDRFPLAGEVLEHATGLVVHSRYVEERVRATGYRRSIARIPHPAWPVPEIAPAAIEGGPVFGCFGYLNEWKRLPQVLEAFSRLGRGRLLLAGAASPFLGALELPPGAVREDHVSEERLWSLLSACDAVVSLRSPTMGETSGTAIRALSLGKPLVVSDAGWFAELPDEVALKVPVGGDEVQALADALELLGSDPARREAMGEAARELVRREHDLERVAEAYASALELAAGGEAVRDAVVREVAGAASEVGIGLDDPEAAELGRRLAEAGLAG